MPNTIRRPMSVSEANKRRLKGAAGDSSTSAEGGFSAAIVGPPPHTAAGERRRFLFGLRMLVIRMRVGADEA